MEFGGGEMAQRMSTLTDLAEDQDAVPSTYIRRLTTACNSSSRTPTTPSGVLRHLHTHGACNPMQAHTYTQNSLKSCLIKKPESFILFLLLFLFIQQTLKC